MIRLLLANKDRLLHFGIRAILNKRSDIVLIDVATSESQLYQDCQKHQPDVLLLAFNLVESSCSEILRYLIQVSPMTHTLLLLQDENEASVPQLLECGGVGCMLANDASDELVVGVRIIASGEVWVSSSLLPALLSSNKQQTLPVLTDREATLLQLMIAEKTDKEIAHILSISGRTVRYHLESIHIKLGTSTRTGAVAEALRRKLIQ